MNKIVIVSHGGLAEGFLDAAKMIVGEVPDVFAFGLCPQEDPENFKERVYAEIDADPKQNILVLADILCGTPFNSMIEKLREPRIDMVIGVNLPMLLELLMHREEKFETLAEYAKQRGLQGIVTKKIFMDGLKETEEEDEHTIYPD